MGVVLPLQKSRGFLSKNSKIAIALMIILHLVGNVQNKTSFREEAFCVYVVKNAPSLREVNNTNNNGKIPIIHLTFNISPSNSLVNFLQLKRLVLSQSFY